jgi:hypothetical protein
MVSRTFVYMECRRGDVSLLIAPLRFAEVVVKVRSRLLTLQGGCRRQRGGGEAEGDRARQARRKLR